MARTNKMGILKKKVQQAKQKQLKGAKVTSLENVKKEYENPKGNKYVRFFRAGKYCCDTTSCREDPDGYRIVRKPNAGEVFFEPNENGYGIRRWRKKMKRRV